LTIADSQVLSM